MKSINIIMIILKSLDVVYEGPAIDCCPWCGVVLKKGKTYESN